MPKRSTTDEEINEKFSDLVKTQKEVVEAVLNLLEDEEVFILQAPKSVNLKKMKGGTMKLGSKSCQISSSTVTHDCIFQPMKKAKIHVADGGAIKQISIKGFIRLKAGKVK